MHIEIDAECRRGLKIIPEIPDIRLCRIEGYNGIGKTSAIRLLQICTGQHPFSGDAAGWRTFRNQLVSAKVRITDLRQADSLEWHLEPRNWSDDPSEALDLALGRVSINGRRVDLRQVQSLLRIYHFNTTETPVKILASNTAAAAATVEDWYAEYGAPRVAQLDEMLNGVTHLLRSVPTAEIRLRLTVAAQAHEATVAISTQVASARARVQILERAIATADRLDAVRGSNPQIESRLRDLSTALKEADKALELLDARIAARDAEHERSQEALERYNKAKQLVARHNTSLRRANDNLSRAAAQAKVDLATQPTDVLTEQLSARLDDLIKSEPEVAVLPQVLALFTDLNNRLDSAIAAELGDRRLIDNVDQTLTVAELRAAFDAEAAKLMTLYRDSDADLLAAQISDLRNRIYAISQIEDLAATVARYQQLLDGAEEALQDASASLATDAQDSISELLDYRQQREAQRRDLQSRIDRLSLERDLISGGSTEDALAVELDDLCRQVGVDPSRIRGSFDRERVRLADLAQEDAEARVTSETERRLLAQRLSHLDSVAQAISSDPRYFWISRIEPTAYRLGGSDLDDRLEAVDRLLDAINRSRDNLTATSAAVQGIGAALEELSNVLQGKSGPGKRDQPWTGPVSRWLASQVQQWFDDDIMRRALFGGGADLRLDPKDLTVSWTVDGDRYERPLASFSSGEQAFAFTRARVAQLDREDEVVANRLIALDEFGAFLDVQNLGRMAEFLRGREQLTPRDQVLVILPVQPGASTEDATRQRQLADHGYYAEAL